MFTGLLFQIKLHLLYNVLLSGFQSSSGALSKAVPGKFHRSGGHIKRNCIQDRAIFHRSWAWQIVPCFNTAYFISMLSCQKGPTRHAYAWHIGPFRQDTIDIWIPVNLCKSNPSDQACVYVPYSTIRFRGNLHSGTGLHDIVNTDSRLLRRLAFRPIRLDPANRELRGWLGAENILELVLCEDTDTGVLVAVVQVALAFKAVTPTMAAHPRNHRHTIETHGV